MLQFINQRQINGRFKVATVKYNANMADFRPDMT